MALTSWELAANQLPSSEGVRNLKATPQEDIQDYVYLAYSDP